MSLNSAPGDVTITLVAVGSAFFTCLSAVLYIRWRLRRKRKLARELQRKFAPIRVESVVHAPGGSRDLLLDELSLESAPSPSESGRSTLSSANAVIDISLCPPRGDSLGTEPTFTNLPPPLPPQVAIPPDRDNTHPSSTDFIRMPPPVTMSPSHSRRKSRTTLLYHKAQRPTSRSPPSVEPREEDARSAYTCTTESTLPPSYRTRNSGVPVLVAPPLGSTQRASVARSAGRGEEVDGPGWSDGAGAEDEEGPGALLRGNSVASGSLPPSYREEQEDSMGRSLRY